MKRRMLGEIIIEADKDAAEKIEAALKSQAEELSGRRLGDILAEDKNFLESGAIYSALAKQYDLPYLNLEKTPIDMNSISAMPFSILQKYQFIPYVDSKNVFHQIIYDPTAVDILDELELYLKTPLNLMVAKKEAVQRMLDKISSLRADVENIPENFTSKIIAEEDGKFVELTSEENDQPVIKLVNSIIFNAIRKHASDIHIESNDLKVVIKYRIDGVLHKIMDDIEVKYMQSIISRIKVMAELNLAEKRVPQDGRFKVRFQGRNIDFRISILPTMYGEVSVIRILDKSHLDLDLKSLGFENKEMERFAKIVKYPYGMILVTGPTGSGKTTSLYSVINYVNSIEDKIITIEDPIEYLLNNTVQIPVNEKKGLTFAKGLRSILRHDPDKIMVGEIRDPETAHIAVQSALTGHLVFTTIHANNVVDVIGRLINMGLNPYEFISALNCILAQRLVRKICTACRKKVNYDSDILKSAGLKISEYKNSVFYEGKGCEHCNNTGYSGRIGIFELLSMSEKIKEMILNKESFSKIRNTAKEEGMISLREAGIEKVLAGVTTLKELNRVTFAEGEMDRI
jgi:type IV pilus assembly protein PilB